MSLLLDEAMVLHALEKSWSKASARQWRADNPACGQCNVTALLIQDLYGGNLLKTPLAAGDHFYNSIDDQRLDFTASQFDQPIAYADLSADRAEAERGVTDAECEALKTAFLQVIDALS